MTSYKILSTLSVLVAVYAVAAQYDTHETSEEEDERGDETPRVDYSKYFGGLGTEASPRGPTQAADTSAGFVQPLGFTGIFATGHFGLDGQLGGESQHVFQTSSGTHPLSSGVFSAHNVPKSSNTSGFVNDVNLPSLFDSSGFSSENRFRPHEFLQPGSRPEPTSRSTFYSPAFATLQKDIDHEVDFQKREEVPTERSRAANRRNPDYDLEDDDDNDDFDSFEFDGSPENEHRTSQKHDKKPLPYENEKSQISPNRKELGYKTPYSIVNQVNLQGTSRPLEPNPSPIKRLPSLTEERDYYDSPANYHSRQQNKYANTLSKHASNSKHGSPYAVKKAHPIQQYKHSPHLQQPTKPPTYQTAYRRPIKNRPPHYLAHQKLIETSPRPHNYNLHKSTSKFRPSSPDPYLDQPKPLNNERRILGPRQHERDGLYSLPQTEYATVVQRKPKETPKPQSKNKKECIKRDKEIDPGEFSRFKRQKMTCYICTNKEKGNTYEECSYESDPRSNSYYKGSTEAFSSDTILRPSKHRISKRSNEKLYSRTSQNQGRKVSEDYYNYDADEPGHGPEHYRFGPEHFHVNDRKQNAERKLPKHTDNNEDYYDGDNDETDVEKEYEPPGASEHDNCHKVNRNGILCMVCQKQNGGGTYEQCSYASDPDANRYEYAKSSSYGSKRPKNYRYKRYSAYENGKSKRYEKNPSNKRHNVQYKKSLDKRGDFRNGKLKRKKVIPTDNRKPLHQSAVNTNKSNKKEYSKIVGLDPFFYGSSESYNPDDYDEKGKKIKRRGDIDDETVASSTEDESEDVLPTYEDSFYRLFPELVGTDPYTGESIEKKTKEREAQEKMDYPEHPQIPYEEVDDEEESESIQTHSKVKPKFNHGVELPDYYFAEDVPKTDLEKTLDEFTHKNRSDCKKVMKDKMTCFQCVNKNGLQHEECMFVAASKPKRKHLAYHEVKEFHVTPTEKNLNESNSDNAGNDYKSEYRDKKINKTNKRTSNTELDYTIKNNGSRPKAYKDTKNNKNTKKYEKSRDLVDPSGNRRHASLEPINSETLAPATQDILKIRPRETNFQYYDAQDNPGYQRKKRNPKDERIPAGNTKHFKRENSSKEDIERHEKSPKQPQSNYNSIPPDPEGFDEREGPEGAYSHETEPVFDSVLKITLPRYMLTRSEHEDIFDEVLKSG